MANIPINQIWIAKDKDLEQQLQMNFNDLSLWVASKESGTYSSIETPAGMTIFPERSGGKSVKRIYIDIAALRASAGTQQIAHGLTYTTLVRLYGIANDTTAHLSLPLPFASSTAADVVGLYADATYINIVVGKDMSAYSARICIEFLD